MTFVNSMTTKRKNYWAAARQNWLWPRFSARGMAIYSSLLTSHGPSCPYSPPTLCSPSLCPRPLSLAIQESSQVKSVSFVGERRASCGECGKAGVCRDEQHSSPGVRTAAPHPVENIDTDRSYLASQRVILAVPCTGDLSCQLVTTTVPPSLLNFVFHSISISITLVRVRR